MVLAEARKRKANFRSQALYWESFRFKRKATFDSPQALHWESFGFERAASFRSQTITTTAPVLQREANGDRSSIARRVAPERDTSYCTYYCSTVLLYYSDTVLLYCYRTIVILYYCTIVIL